MRQLENVCHWLTVMAPAQLIEAKDLPPELLGAPPRAAAAASVEGEAPTVAAGDAAAPVAQVSSAAAAPQAAVWLDDLEREARSMLVGGVADVWDALTRQFEARLIHAALDVTRGRRIEAAHKLGIGRNTITRKIQELGLED